MPDVLEINDPAELDDHRALWSALLAETPRATFFQSLDWLAVYWRHFGDAQRLRMLIITEAGEPIGILPLVVRTESTRVGKVRVLTYPLHDWGTYYGPIGPNAADTLRIGLRHVRNTPRNWDLLDLRWVDEAADEGKQTEAAMWEAGFVPNRQPWAQAALVRISGTWEDYWMSRASAWRNNVRRNCRRLRGLGEVRYLRYRPAGLVLGDVDPRWDLYDACVEIARRSWQGHVTVGTTMSHDSVRQYLRDTHLAATRCGALDLNLLLVDLTPVAFAYNYHFHGCVYGLRAGFDPAWSAAGPGTVLGRMLAEDSFRRGDQLWDLGIGSLHTKRHWLTSLETSYRYTHFPCTAVRAQALRLKRWFTRLTHGDDYLAGERKRRQAEIGLRDNRPDRHRAAGPPAKGCCRTTARTRSRPTFGRCPSPAFLPRKEEIRG